MHKLVLSFMILHTACSGQGSFSSGSALSTSSPEKPKTNETDKTGSSQQGRGDRQTEADRVVPPVGTTGSYLTCGTQLEPSERLLEGSIACRLEDENGKVVNAASSGIEARYELRSNPNASVAVTLEILSFSGKNYDINLSFRGDDVDQIAESMKNSVLDVSLSKAGSGEALSSFSSALKDVEKSFRGSGWTIEAGNGPALDLASGLLWSPNGRRKFTLSEAIDYCNDLVFAGEDNWLLPSLAELQVARAHGIGSSAQGLQAMSIDSNLYWTTTASRQLADHVMSIELLDNLVSTDVIPRTSHPDQTYDVICRSESRKSL